MFFFYVKEEVPTYKISQSLHRPHAYVFLILYFRQVFRYVK